MFSISRLSNRRLHTLDHYPSRSFLTTLTPRSQDFMPATLHRGRGGSFPYYSLYLYLDSQFESQDCRWSRPSHRSLLPSCPHLHLKTHVDPAPFFVARRNLNLGSPWRLPRILVGLEASKCAFPTHKEVGRSTR